MPCWNWARTRSGGLGRSNGRDTCRKRPARSDSRWRDRCGGTAARARPGGARGRCLGKRMFSAKARERRDWRDPWRPVVGRTGRAQARSVRVGSLCLDSGVSTKPRGRALANRGARNCDRRAASKWTAGLRAAGPRLPRIRGLCAAAVSAADPRSGRSRPRHLEAAGLVGYWASGAQRRARATQPARRVAGRSRPHAA